MKTCEIKYDILYADTDAMGIVYYANYLRFYEAGRRAFFKSLNIAEDKLKEMGYIFPAVSVNMKYHKPGEINDEIFIKTGVSDTGAAVINFKQSIYHKNKGLLNEADIKLACVNPENLKPKRCPGFLIEAFGH